MTTQTKITNPILLIDADMLLYRIAAGLQEDTDWGDDIVSVTIDMRAAKNVINHEMQRLYETLGTAYHMLCFTDPNKNFRTDIFPGYKAGRGRKPVGYRKLVEYTFSEYNCLCMPGLEADDIMGIMMTDKHASNGVIVSGDKDMLTIPGRHFQLHGAETWADVRVVGAQEAHYNHMMQTLTGDSTDGYPGCKGVGPKTAAKVFDGIVGNLWPTVLACFLERGFDEDYAIVQAQLARILHASDIDPIGNAIRLWAPEAEDWVPTDLVLS